MTITKDFDKAAARSWLQGPDVDETGYAVAESLGIEDDFSYESDSWISTVNNLVDLANSQTTLIPEGTLFWMTADAEGVLDGALVTRQLADGLRLCSSFLGFRDLIDNRATTGIDNAVSVLSAVHLLASGLRLPGKPTVDDPAAFADTEDLIAEVTVNAFRLPGETLSIREWAERGWEAIRDLTAPVIALRNLDGQEVVVDLESDGHEENETSGQEEN